MSHVSMNAHGPTICTFPTQIDGVFMQKVPKSTHYLSGFQLPTIFARTPL
jgi:hypothetical protein